MNNQFELQKYEPGCIINYFFKNAYYLTESSFGDMGRSRITRFTRASFVDCANAELVLLAFLQPWHSSLAVRFLI